MSAYPKMVKPADVVNSIFGPGLFSVPGGKAVYDEIWMADGGNSVYLCRVNPDLSVTKRLIGWDVTVIQHYDPAK